MPALVLSEITLSSNSEIAPTIENTMRPTWKLPWEDVFKMSD
jgi:hypothetical protein